MHEFYRKLVLWYRYGSLKQRLEIRQAEVEMVRTRLQQTAHHQVQTEVNQLQASLGMLHSLADKGKAQLYSIDCMCQRSCEVNTHLT